MRHGRDRSEPPKHLSQIDRETTQIGEVLLVKHLPHIVARGDRQLPLRLDALAVHVVANRRVVIASYHIRGTLLQKREGLRWAGSIIDQVSEAEQVIVWFLRGLATLRCWRARLK